MLQDNLKITTVYEMLLYRGGRQTGRIERIRATNLIPDAAKTDILSRYLGTAGAAPANWFFGLTNNGGFVATDTLASKAWTEISNYSGSRPTWHRTTATAKQIKNTPGTSAAFSFTSGATVYGVFMCSVATGTSGLLFSEALLPSPLSVNSPDEMDITSITFSIT